MATSDLETFGSQCGTERSTRGRRSERGERLIQYFLPFSQARMIEVPDAGKAGHTKTARSLRLPQTSAHCFPLEGLRSGPPSRKRWQDFETHLRDNGRSRGSRMVLRRP